MSDQITGTTAADIASSVRELRQRGVLTPGAVLPPVRELAARLGVNRNTAVSAYRQLAQAGLVISRGRAGTMLVEHSAVAQEGYAADTVLRDVGTGNPDPRLIPDPSPVLASVTGRPVLYGEPVIDTALDAWARDWVSPDLHPSDFQITITSGAVDAVERLLAQALMRDDAVALEDPCFLASIHTVRLGGYRAVPVPVDDEGMTVEGLQAALDAGVRAVICTPRAQNPTGASLSQARAAALRELMAEHPYVLIIEDDHFSMLSSRPYESLIGPEHKRFALLRSVSKFLGPDMCLAVAATDRETAGQLAMRLSPGTTWVSHLLQRLTLGLLSNEQVRESIRASGAHYVERNTAFAGRLRDHGIGTHYSDGMNLWVELPQPAQIVSERLMRRGWLVRTGDGFSLIDTDRPSHHLRLTVHDLSPTDAEQLVADIAAAID
ncbi:aminotransferase class I/II-fold pyridoxal phosphate-dependent enzyme [Microbacterium sp. A588]